MKPFISIGPLLIFFALFPTTLPGVEKKDSADLTKIITTSYVINTRYLLGCDYYSQGIRYSNSQQYDNALAYFRKAVELLPNAIPTPPCSGCHLSPCAYLLLISLYLEIWQPPKKTNWSHLKSKRKNSAKKDGAVSAKKKRPKKRI